MNRKIYCIDWVKIRKGEYIREAQANVATKS